MNSKSILILAFWVCLTPLCLRSATHLVTSTNDAGMGTLRQVVNLSNAGDTILFSQSTNGIPIELSSGELLLLQDLVIIGNGASQTYIEGLSTQRVFNVFNTTLRLEGLNISNGFSPDGGGALIATNSSLFITSCIFNNNAALFQGGALLLNSCNTSIFESEFNNNQATVNLSNYGGGAIRNHGGSLTIENTMFSANVLLSGGLGGAILNDSAATLTIGGCSFNNNIAVKAGGAIAEVSETANTNSISASTFNNNSTTGISSAGGAILLGSGSLIVNNSTFENNRSAVEGGAIWIGMGHLVLDNSQLSSNVSGGDIVGGYGGAIYLNQGKLDIQNNCSILQNSASGENSFGGGVYVDSSGLLSIENSNISSNIAGQAGAGIADNSDNTTTTIIMNSSIDSNTVQGTTGAAGGILLGSGRMTIGSASVSGNQSAVQGGGIWVGTGELVLDKVQIMNNSTGGDQRGLGGGLFIKSGVATIQNNSTISANTSQGLGSLGGGIYIDAAGSFRIEDSRIENNTSVQAGGGLADNSSGVTTNLINNSFIENNMTNGPSSAGGGILLGIGKIDIINSSISNNQSAVQGGGIWTFSGSLNIENANIANNSTGGQQPGAGGGLFLKNGDLAISNNSHLTGNSAMGEGGQGGGIFLENTTELMISESLFEDNLAAQSGGALFDNSQGSSQTVISNSLFNNNLTLGPLSAGGAMVIGNGSMLIENCLLQNNTTGIQGGCIWMDTARVQISGSEILNNSSGGEFDGYGGAVFCRAGQLVIDNGSHLSGNFAIGSKSVGGALYCGPFSSFTISESILSKNQAGYGGAIVAVLDTNQSHLINNSVLSENRALDSFGYGGALAIFGSGNLDIDSCELNQNKADFSGAALWNFADSVFIINTTLDSNEIESANSGGGGGAILNARGYLGIKASTLSNNSSLDSTSIGGGIWNLRGAMLDIERSTLSNNFSANAGGGIFNEGKLSLKTSTLAFNEAKIAGGGLYFYNPDSLDQDSASTLLISSIIAQNQAGNIGNNIYGDGLAVRSGGYNLIATGSGNILQAAAGDLLGSEIDPVIASLMPLDDNGGPTLTHAIDCESPAINAGDPEISSPDQRGQSVYGPQRDIGSFEYQDSCATSSISNVSGLKSLFIYPNPIRSDELTLKFAEQVHQNLNVALLNTATGKIHLHTTLKAPRWVLNIGHIPPGHYILRIENEGNIVSKKLILLD